MSAAACGIASWAERCRRRLRRRQGASARQLAAVPSQLVAHIRPYLYLTGMAGQIRKITVNVPTDVLDSATRATGKGVTLTVIEGLRELERMARRSALRSLRGKVRFDLDLTRTRS